MCINSMTAPAPAVIGTPPPSGQTYAYGMKLNPAHKRW